MVVIGTFKNERLEMMDSLNDSTENISTISSRSPENRGNLCGSDLQTSTSALSSGSLKQSNTSNARLELQSHNLSCPYDTDYTDKTSVPGQTNDTNCNLGIVSDERILGSTKKHREPKYYNGKLDQQKDEDFELKDFSTKNLRRSSSGRSRQLQRAVRNLDRTLKLMKIKPPWCDPNSHPLPSDQTASFYDLYEEFTRSSRNAISANRYDTRREVAVCRPYHTTLNRYREQERIQMENYAIAKRLENVRPTQGMTKQEQLREYKRYFLPPGFCPKVKRPQTANVFRLMDFCGDHDTKRSVTSARSSQARNSERYTRSNRTRSLASSVSTLPLSISNKDEFNGHAERRMQPIDHRRNSSTKGSVNPECNLNIHGSRKSIRKNSRTSRNNSAHQQQRQKQPKESAESQSIPSPPPPSPTEK